MIKPKFTFMWFIRLLTILVAVSSCREIYVPELDSQAGVLVVEGLVTNLHERAFVKLSVAGRYGSGNADSAVKKAMVLVLEDNLVTYSLKEIHAGYYVSDPDEFQARTGHSYSLQIITSDGIVYKSEPQILLPGAEIDSIHGHLLSKEYIYTDVYGKTVGKMEQVDQTYLNFRINTNMPVQFRFKSTLLTGYTWINDTTTPYPSVIYMWKKRNPDNTIIMTGSGNEINVQSAENYAVSYFPLNEYFYELRPIEHINNWFLQVRQYTLNNEAYQYYKDVNSQLSSTGAIFDPIAAQIQGNISCPNNPDRLVLGFFEVSGCTKITTYIKPHTSFNTADYYPAVDLDSIPDEGYSVQEAPFFWQFIK